MDRDEILYLLSHAEHVTGLLRKSDAVRHTWCGDEVHIRGIIEFSNYCCRNCLYCGLRRDNRKITRYRMAEDDIIARAIEIAAHGIRTIVLQSGDDFYFTQAMLCRIVTRIKERTGVAVTLSVGERPFEDYAAFRQAGADRYLLKYETANETLYARLHPHHTLAGRLRILDYLRNLGFQTGTGNIVGLPGQTLNDLCSDILLLGELDTDMTSIGLFLPQQDTPLSGCPCGDVPLTLKVLALARMETRNSHMPVTTALVTANPEGGLADGLRAGANVIMPDFTPEQFRKDYAIYDNKVQITPANVKEAILTVHRKVAEGPGDTLKPCR